eukprot:Pgem_evm1s19659
MTNSSIQQIEENLKTKTFNDNNLNTLWNIEQNEREKIIKNRRINAKRIPKILKSHIWILTQRKPTRQSTSKTQPFQCQYCSKEFPPEVKLHIFEHKQNCKTRLEWITYIKKILHINPNIDVNSNNIHNNDYNAKILGTKVQNKCFYNKRTIPLRIIDYTLWSYYEKYNKSQP